MYIEKDKIIFIHIPKCAGTSIEKYLINLYKYNIPDYMWISPPNKDLLLGVIKNFSIYTAQNYSIEKIVEYKKLDRNLLNQYTIFTVVRNPYHRTLSDLIYNNLLNSNNTFDVYNILIKYFQSKSTYDNHKIPQYKFLTLNDIIYPNIIIIKFENISKDIKILEFMKHFNIYENKKKHNIDYDSLLTVPVKELIYKHYNMDFDYFNYEK
jgi:hypothetical protein